MDKDQDATAKEQKERRNVPTAPFYQTLRLVMYEHLKLWHN